MYLISYRNSIKFVSGVFVPLFLITLHTRFCVHSSTDSSRGITEVFRFWAVITLILLNCTFEKVTKCHNPTLRGASIVPTS
jgi:hypothetical protein